MNKCIQWSIVVVFLIGCGEKEQSREYYKSGKLKSKLIIVDGSRPKCFEYYENGKVKSEGELSDGNRVGAWNYYNEDGTLKAHGYYNDGLKEGRWNYNIGDSSQKIDWDIYLNRPLKINVPKGWVLKESLAPFVPLAVFSDSSNWEANFNIVVLDRNERQIDSVISEVLRKNREHAISEILSIKGVEINGLKGKEVTQRVFTEGKRLIVAQYFLEQPDTVYLLSFFVDESKVPLYNTLIKEIAYSFNLI